MNKYIQVSKYVVSDFLGSIAAWVLFYRFRKIFIEVSPVTYDYNFYLGLTIIPLFWLLLYGFTGCYDSPFRKYRMKELSQTFWFSLLGVVILFFTLLLDDKILSYTNYYKSIFALFSLQFGFVFPLRLILTTQTVKKIHAEKIGFKTIIIGGNQRAVKILNEIKSLKRSPGFSFVGFASVNGSDHLLEANLEHLGHVTDIEKIIKEHEIEEVILAMESSEHEFLGKIITELEGLDVKIKIIPDMYDIMSGSVKTQSIFGAALLDVKSARQTTSYFTIKRAMDIFVSVIALIILSPLLLVIAISVKLSSKGPIIFSQERIGKNGKPFMIHKFRSMYTDAEKNGPQLSSQSDSRITKSGKMLRKTRMDELPQFYNVLIGEMTLVGPRPERQFYIDQIKKEAPHYRMLSKVKPGITSWGQVKYGYAESVEQMVSRLKYDILYVENMSLALDLKILIYTILIVLRREGK